MAVDLDNGPSVAIPDDIPFAAVTARDLIKIIEELV
jgi:hypothetical protein